MKKTTRRCIAALLAAMTIFSTAFEPLTAHAAENASESSMEAEQTISDSDAAEPTISAGDSTELTVSGGDAPPLTVSGGDATNMTVSGGDAAELTHLDLSDCFLMLTNDSVTASGIRKTRSVGGLAVGDKINYPTDLGGSYSTHYYTINGNIAYCMQPDQGVPQAGNYELETKNDPNAIRAIVYGYGGPFQNVMEEWLTANGVSTDADTMYVYTHIAVSYYYTTNYEKAFTGVSGWQNSMAYAWIQYLYNNTSMPLTFSTASGTASVSKNILYAGLKPGGYLNTEQIYIAGSVGTDWIGTKWSPMYLGAYKLDYSYLTDDPYCDNFTDAETSILSNFYSFSNYIKGSHYNNYAYNLKNDPSYFYEIIKSASYFGELNCAVMYTANACYHLDSEGNAVKDSDEYYICMHDGKERDPSIDTHICSYTVSGNSYSMTEYEKRFLNSMIYQGSQLFKVRLNTTGTGYTLQYVNTGSSTQDVGYLYSFSLPAGGSMTDFTIHYLTGAAIKIKKTDEKDNPLSGAKFGIYEDSSCTTPVSVIKYDSVTDRYIADYIGNNGIVTTGADGIADLGYLSGYYETIYVKETEAPSGYKLDETVHEINLADGEYHDASNPIVLTITNERDSYIACITKKKMNSDITQAGAVYGVYENVSCTGFIDQFPATGTDGTSSLEISSEHPIIYLKEIEAPIGLALNPTVYTWNLTEDTQMDVYDSEQFGKLTIRKTGAALDTASCSDNQTLFHYTNQGLAGAHFRITAGSDIYDIDGNKRYSRGDIVAADIVTDANGNASVSDLFIGFAGASYIITETQSPVGYSITEEPQTVTLTYNNQVEIVESTVNFVDNRLKTSVTVTKKDEARNTPLSGAVIGLYAATDIRNNTGTVIIKKDTLIETVTTGSGGTANFISDLPTNGRFYIRELQAPAGYRLNTNQYHVVPMTDNIVIPGIKVEVTDTEQFGEITVYKEGEVLTGWDGNDFIYETKKLPGFTFRLTAGADIYRADGSKVYSMGDTVVTELVTGEDGSVRVVTDSNGEKLHLGEYVITETDTVAGYLLDNTAYTVSLNYAGQSAEVAAVSHAVTDKRQTASIEITKKDLNDNQNPLMGGEYTLYADEDIYNYDGTLIVHAGTPLETIITGRDGKATCNVDLPIGYQYHIAETKAPYGYIRDLDDIYEFTFDYMENTISTASFSYTFANKRVNALIRLQKFDAETGIAVPQGDAALTGAVYGIYAKEDISHPDGITGILFKADELVTMITTDENGYAKATDLYLGKYYCKEITPSKGYLLNEDKYDIDCSYEGDLVSVVIKDIISKEQVIKQPFQLIKITENGFDTEASLIEGAGFTAYLKSTLTVLEDGSYDFKNAVPIPLTADYSTILYTDRQGFAQSIPLPYGTYIVKEVVVPANLKEIQPFTVTVKENAPDTPQIWRIFLDREFTAKLRIVKKDSETGMTVLQPGAEFRIYDLNDEEYVKQYISYPSKEELTSFFTDEDGDLILPEALKPGNYRIEEISAPFGYVLNTSYPTVTITSNAAYMSDPDTGDAIITVAYEDAPATGSLSIRKLGEVLTGYQEHVVSSSDNSKTEGFFVYEVQSLAGAKFAVYAAEDIYTADMQKDKNGNRTKYYSQNEYIGEIVTGADGSGILSNLPLGKYKIVETEAPCGYVRNSEPQYVTLRYVDQNTPVVTYHNDWINTRPHVVIHVYKHEKNTDHALAGAKFGLYCKNDITIDDKVLLSANELIEEALTDTNGNITFMADLPWGYEYYIAEIQAPDGFITDHSHKEAFSLTEDVADSKDETFELCFNFENEATTSKVTKLPSPRGRIVLIIEEDTPLWNLVNGYTSPKLLGAARFKWNNARTEDSGIAGFTIFATSEHPVFPFLLSGILLIIISVTGLIKTKKKQNKEETI